MPLTVRLGPKAERALNSLAKRQGQSRSQVVREALEQYEATVTSKAGTQIPYDAWLDVIGAVNVAARHGGRTTGEQLTNILREKARARRAR
jgi:metal-responsive CopG/Arc/MetJ family transcriptional regulator